MYLIIPCVSLLVLPLVSGFALRQEVRMWYKTRQGMMELLQQAVPPMWSTRRWSIGLSLSLGWGCLYLFFKILICFVYGILPSWIYVYHVHVQCSQRLEEGAESPGTGVSDGCQPCECWELNRGPLEVQTVALTIEPLLQPQCLWLAICWWELLHCLSNTQYKQLKGKKKFFVHHFRGFSSWYFGSMCLDRLSWQ